MISAEEASNIGRESSILKRLNEKVKNRAAEGYTSACIYQVRKQYQDSEIKEAMEKLEDLGYEVELVPEAGMGPDVLAIYWCSFSPSDST